MLKKFILGCLFLSIMPVWGTTLVPQQMNAQISLKMPGNQYNLHSGTMIVYFICQDFGIEKI